MAKSDYGKDARSAAHDSQTRERWEQIFGSGTRETGVFIYCTECERIVDKANHPNRH